MGVLALRAFSRNPEIGSFNSVPIFRAAFGYTDEKPNRGDCQLYYGKRLMRHFKFISLVLLIVPTWVQPLYAQAAKSFFAGKTITMLAGSSPGGGTDQIVRLIARHMERYVPGKPTILVVNKPGAGGMIAINELYNLRKPDGMTMSNINTGAIFAVAGGNEAIKFD